MLTGLKMSSLPCKDLFYRADHNAKEETMELKFEGLEIKK